MHGTEKLKIGELAEKANVTKRKIDHYTNLGLLKAERSPSNYRYYDHSTIERLDFIEKCQRENMTLDEIKKTLLEKDAEEINIQDLRLKMQDLENDVSKILSYLEKNDKKNYDFVKNNISHDSLSLIQTLLVLIH